MITVKCSMRLPISNLIENRTALTVGAIDTLPSSSLISLPFCHLSGVPSLSHSTTKLSSSATVPIGLELYTDVPIFLATTGSTTSSQSCPRGGVKPDSGGLKCAAMPSREDGGVLMEASMLRDTERGVCEFIPVLVDDEVP